MQNSIKFTTIYLLTSILACSLGIVHLQEDLIHCLRPRLITRSRQMEKILGVEFVIKFTIASVKYVSQTEISDHIAIV